MSKYSAYYRVSRLEAMAVHLIFGIGLETWRKWEKKIILRYFLESLHHLDFLFKELLDVSGAFS